MVFGLSQQRNLYDAHRIHGLKAMLYAPDYLRCVTKLRDKAIGGIRYELY